MNKFCAVITAAALLNICIPTYTFSSNANSANYVVKNAIVDDSRIFINRAAERFANLDFNGAIAIFNEAIAQKPNDKELYLNRGYLKQIIGDLDGAMQDYNAAISLDSNYAYAYNNRGVLKISLKDINGAMQDYETALNINSGYADVYYNRANLKYMLDDNKGALADYDKAIEYNPNDSDAYNNRGVVKKRMNLNVGALSDYSQAIAINPKDSIAYANRGRLKKLYFDNEGAAIDLDQAVALAENQAFIKNVKPLISNQHYIAAIPDISSLITDRNSVAPISNPTPKLYSQNKNNSDNQGQSIKLASVNNNVQANKPVNKSVKQNPPAQPVKKTQSPTFNAGVASVKIAEAPDIRTTQVAASATTKK